MTNLREQIAAALASKMNSRAASTASTTSSASNAGRVTRSDGTYTRNGIRYNADGTPVVKAVGMKGISAALTRSDKRALHSGATASTDDAATISAALIDSTRRDTSAITLDPSQSTALEILRTSDSPYVCLSGAAGTGKTTVVRFFINSLNIQERVLHKGNSILNVLFLAFTGKAVSQLKAVLPERYHECCMTIHAALGYYPEDAVNSKGEPCKHWVPTYDATNHLNHTLIFIDESTMCNVSLWNKLRAATLPNCRFVFIGDINQLPPVGGQPILAHALMNYPHGTLEQIHRQSAESPVLRNAHKILRCEPIQSEKGFAMLSLPVNGMSAAYKVRDYIKLLYDQGSYDPIQDQIITGSNDNELGQSTLNALICPYVNANKPQKVFLRVTQKYFAVGDKVMYTKNDYERNLFNGTQGIVTAIVPNDKCSTVDSLLSLVQPSTISYDFLDQPIQTAEDLAKYRDRQIAGEEQNLEADKEDGSVEGHEASHKVTVSFNDGSTHTFSLCSELGALQLSYVCTCHKMQGSECRKVIIICHQDNAFIQSREWLYTAVTRAKDSVLLLSSRGSLARTMNSPRISGRTVEDKIKSFYTMVLKNSTDEKPIWSAG